jgi:Putative adhesin
MRLLSSRIAVTASLLLLGTATSICAQRSSQLARGWSVAPRAAIKVHAVSGALLVQGWDHDSVSISGPLAQGESYFGGGTLTGLKLGVEGSRVSGESRVLVRVPFGARLVVRSGGASIEVIGVSGTIDVGAASGNIDISGTIESIIAESISGDVEIAGTSRIVRARTSGGSLTMAGTIGEAALNSVSGSVSVRGQPTGTLRIETVNGDVRVMGPLASRGAIDIETFGGRITLEFPRNQSAALNIRSSSGSVVDETSGASTQQPSSSRKGGALVRDIGVSALRPPVTVRTFGGTVSIAVLRGER